MSIHEEGEIISIIFTRPMKNGGLGLILNLSDLNINLQYHHFNMDDINVATSYISFFSILLPCFSRPPRGIFFCPHFFQATQKIFKVCVERATVSVLGPT